MILGDFELINQEGDKCLYKIVSTEKEENYDLDIVYICVSASIVQATLCAYKKFEKKFFLENRGYLISKFNAHTLLISKDIIINSDKREKRIVDFTNDNQIEDVYIFRRIFPCINGKQHKRETVRAKVIAYQNYTFGSKFIEVEYCSICKKYFISTIVLRQSEKKYGVLLFQRRNQGFKDEKEHFFAQDTILSRWGYIAQSNKQSEKHRRAILVYLLEKLNISKSDILKILSSFIEYRENCHKAQAIWQADYDFVERYNIYKERKITARLLEK